MANGEQTNTPEPVSALESLRREAEGVIEEVRSFLETHKDTAGEEIVRGLEHRVGALDFILVSTPNDMAGIEKSVSHLRESLAKAWEVLVPGSSEKKAPVFTNQGPKRTVKQETAAGGFQRMVRASKRGAEVSGSVAKRAFWASVGVATATWRFFQFLWRSISVIGTMLLTLHTILFFSQVHLPGPLTILGSAYITPLVWIVYVLAKAPFLVTQRSGDEAALVQNVVLSLIPSHILFGIGCVAVFSAAKLPPWGWSILVGGLLVVFSVLLLQLYFSMRLAERTGEFGIGAPPH